VIGGEKAQNMTSNRSINNLRTAVLNAKNQREKSQNGSVFTHNILQQNLQPGGVLPRIQNLKNDLKNEKQRILNLRVAAKPMSSPKQPKTNFSNFLVQQTLLSENSYLAGTKIVMDKLVPLPTNTLEQTKKSFADQNLSKEDKQLFSHHQRKGSN